MTEKNFTVNQGITIKALSGNSDEIIIVGSNGDLVASGSTITDISGSLNDRIEILEGNPIPDIFRAEVADISSGLDGRITDLETQVDDISSSLDNYVLKSGDTMTGDLSAPNLLAGNEFDFATLSATQLNFTTNLLGDHSYTLKADGQDYITFDYTNFERNVIVNKDLIVETLATNDDQIVTLDPDGKLQASGTTLADLGSVPTWDYPADVLESPFVGDWEVSDNAPVTNDSVNAALSVRRFDDTVVEGCGFSFRVVPNTTQVRIRFISRAQSAENGNIVPAFYVRRISDNSQVTAWSTIINGTPIAVTSNLNWHHDEEVFAFSSFGSIQSGDLVQVQLVRNVADAGDTLVGDWSLLRLGVELE